MKKITPFLKIDDQGIPHFSANDLLLACGLPPTDENLRLATGHLIKLLKHLYPKTSLRLIMNESRPDEWITPEQYRVVVDRLN